MIELNWIVYLMIDQIEFKKLTFSVLILNLNHFLLIYQVTSLYRFYTNFGCHRKLNLLLDLP